MISRWGALRVKLWLSSILRKDACECFLWSGVREPAYGLLSWYVSLFWYDGWGRSFMTAALIHPRFTRSRIIDGTCKILVWVWLHLKPMARQLYWYGFIRLVRLPAWIPAYPQRSNVQSRCSGIKILWPKWMPRESNFAAFLSRTCIRNSLVSS